MQHEALDVNIQDVTIRDYINNCINEIKKDYELEINKLKTDVIEYQNKYLEIKERYDLLVYKRFGQSAERLIAAEKQPLLFSSESKETKTTDENIEYTEVKSHKRNKCGRKPIDGKIRREEKIIDIPESEKVCACGATLSRIGEETSEKLQIIPPKIFVEKTVRPKYACRCCEGTATEGKVKTVRIAPVEPSIIPRSIVSPSLLSTIITQKFELHLPYYRQEKQFKCIGVTISRQDMSNWQQKAYKVLTPIFGLLKEAVKSGPVIQMDETTVQVMGEEGRDDTQKSRMWLARGGPPGRTVLWYEYHETRAASHARTFLQGYSGYLQTDGYDGYDAAVKELPGIVHAGCFAHARRYFFEAAKVTSDKKLTQPSCAEEGMNHIKKLYAIEKALRSRYTLDDQVKIFLRVRQLCAFRPLKDFKEWLEKLNDEVLPTSLLGKAVYYSLSQWDKLVLYLKSPYLTPDNNACENAIRPFVLGRKNWLFCQSPDGADSSCGMFTLIETAKQNGLVPFQYLAALFEKAPFAKTTDDWKKLLPWNIFIG